MRRLTPAVMMMAVNHKGRVIYANTQLAALLGYKLKQLRWAALCTIGASCLHMCTGWGVRGRRCASAARQALLLTAAACPCARQGQGHRRADAAALRPAAQQVAQGR